MSHNNNRRQYNNKFVKEVDPVKIAYNDGIKYSLKMLYSVYTQGDITYDTYETICKTLGFRPFTRKFK